MVHPGGAQEVIAVTNYVQVSGVGFQVSEKNSARWIAVPHKADFLSPVLAFSIILLAV